MSNSPQVKSENISKAKLRPRIMQAIYELRQQITRLNHTY